MNMIRVSNWRKSVIAILFLFTLVYLAVFSATFFLGNYQIESSSHKIGVVSSAIYILVTIPISMYIRNYHSSIGYDLPDCRFSSLSAISVVYYITIVTMLSVYKNSTPNAPSTYFYFEIFLRNVIASIALLNTLPILYSKHRFREQNIFLGSNIAAFVCILLFEFVPILFVPNYVKHGMAEAVFNGIFSSVLTVLTEYSVLFWSMILFYGDVITASCLNATVSMLISIVNPIIHSWVLGSANVDYPEYYLVLLIVPVSLFLLQYLSIRITYRKSYFAVDIPTIHDNRQRISKRT